MSRKKLNKTLWKKKILRNIKIKKKPDQSVPLLESTVSFHLSRGLEHLVLGGS